MKAFIIAAGLVAVVVSIAVAFCVGWHYGKQSVPQQPHDYWDKLVQLDRSLLASVPDRPNTLVPGIYILETSFPDEPKQMYTLNLIRANERFLTLESQSMGPLILKRTSALDGTMVSFALGHNDPDEGPDHQYVGLIDGNMAWGRVYVPPGDGWHADDPPAVGVWRLYLKP